MVCRAKLFLDQAHCRLSIEIAIIVGQCRNDEIAQRGERRIVFRKEGDTYLFALGQFHRIEEAQMTVFVDRANRP
jgi:hypothetical protein